MNVAGCIGGGGANVGGGAAVTGAAAGIGVGAGGSVRGNVSTAWTGGAATCAATGAPTVTVVVETGVPSLCQTASSMLSRSK